MVDDALGVAGGARGVVERDGVATRRREDATRIAGSPPARKRLVVARPAGRRRGRSRSATSITRSGRPSFAQRAPRIVGANSVSVTSTFASPWPSMKAMASASSRVLSAFSTAPDIGTPKCISTISGCSAASRRRCRPPPTPARDNALREAPAALGDLRPGVAARAVDHRELRGPDRRRAIEERQRRQGRVVRGVALEASLVRIHCRPSWCPVPRVSCTRGGCCAAIEQEPSGTGHWGTPANASRTGSRPPRRACRHVPPGRCARLVRPSFPLGPPPWDTGFPASSPARATPARPAWATARACRRTRRGSTRSAPSTSSTRRSACSRPSRCPPRWPR